MAYRAVFFDLGRVLVPFDISHAYAALKAASPLSLKEMQHELQSSKLVPDYECGRISDQVFVDSIRKLLQLDVTFEEFDRIWNSIFLPATLVSEELLLQLRERYTLLLLSNTNALHYRFLEQQYPHIQHFHHHILSFEVGAEKPDPAIYQAAFQTAGVAPQEAFFTDDMPENIEAARALGLDAECFVGVDALMGHLRQRGILS